MKTKLIIDIEKKGESLEITYTRRDLKQPETKEEKLLLLYIEAQVRATIDGGFAPAKKKESDDGEPAEKQ